MITDFQYIYGGDIVLSVLAIVTKATSVSYNCAMEDAEEPSDGEVNITSVTLEDGSEFDTDGHTVGGRPLIEILQEEAATEAAA